VAVLKVPLGMIKFMGLFAAKFNYAANIITALNNYPEKFGAEETWKELGKPETRLEKYASESKAV
jgi:hypothetical protein